MGPPPRSLGDLVREWHARGEALPVAIAVSILDDLLLQPDTTTKRPHLDQVVIDDRGVARLESNDPGNLDDLAPIVAEMLGDGDAVPPNARVLLARLTSDDPTERPADADQLRSWIRDSLGAPAAREEVLACFTGTELEESLLPPPSLVESTAEAPEAPPIPEAVEEAHDDEEDDEQENLPTLPPEKPLPVPEMVEEILPPAKPDETEVLDPLEPPRPSTYDLIRDATIGEGHHPSVDHDLSEDRLRDETIASSPPRTPVERLQKASRQTPEKAEKPPKPQDPDRPVVRHQSLGSGPRASVDSAPAARRSPKPLTTAGGDSLILPAERRGNWGVWLFVLAVVGAAVWFYLLR